MRTREGLVIPGIILFVVGVLMFFVSEEITVRIALVPFSMILILAFVGGIILILIGLASFMTERL